MPRIDAIRQCLSDFDLDGLKDINSHIVKTAIKNKVFKKCTINSLKVAVIDYIELFESTKKYCNKCLLRKHKDALPIIFIG